MRKKLLTAVLAISILTAFAGIPGVFAATYESKISFDDASADDSAADLEDFALDWEIGVGRPQDGGVVVEEGGKKYLTLNGYVEISTWDLIESPYTYSVDVKIAGDGSENTGFFVRSVLPIEKFNPKNGGGIQQTLNYFESDWYSENTGKAGTSSIGGSGIVVSPLKSGFVIRIKNWQPDGLNTASSKITIPIPQGVDMTAFNTLSFSDDGAKVEIKVNNILLATVEMSNAGVYEEDQTDENQYFKTVSVKNAAGEEVLKLDNAKLSAGESQVALGNRNVTVHIDNMTLTYQVPDPTPTPEPTDTPAPTATPTAKATTATPDTTEESEEDTNALPFIIGGAVVLVVAVGVILIVVSKKKK